MTQGQSPGRLATVVARAALVALFVALLAAMPVTSSMTSPVHEVWLAGEGTGFSSMPRLRVYVHDRTGLVRAVSAATEDATSAPRRVVVSWMGGCGDWRTDLYFYRQAGGYRVDERTAEAGCAFLVGYPRTVVLHLWSPIDPTSVLVSSRSD